MNIFRSNTSKLKAAILDSNLDKVKKYLKSGAKITPDILCSAIVRNHLEIIDILLEHGAPINVCHNGMYPINWVVRDGGNDLLELLIKHGASIENIRYEDLVDFNDTPYYISKLRYLLQNGMSPNIRDIFNSPMIYMFIRYNYTELAKCLIEYGADINFRDSIWHTPIVYATIKNNIELISILLDKGAILTEDDQKFSSYSYRPRKNTQKNKNKPTSFENYKKIVFNKPREDIENFPDHLKCSICLNIMDQPVTDTCGCGQSYDYKCIRNLDKCPTSRKSYTGQKFIPNRTLRDAIEYWAKENKHIIL